MLFFEASAKEGYNVQESFLYLATVAIAPKAKPEAAGPAAQDTAADKQSEP